MAAIVTCKYCGKKFDREKETYVQIPAGTRFRYGHSDCYLQAVNGGKEKNHYEIFDPKEFKNCFWCAQAINPKDNDVIELKGLYGRYAHKACNEKHPENDRENFMVYLIKLYQIKEDSRLLLLLKQADQIAKEYRFSYSGMMKALEYFYKIKQHPVDKTKGCGIIPYVYNQAYKYYYNLWLAQEQNKTKDFNDYIPKDIVVKITSPERKPERRKLFTFLEEDNINAE